MATKLSIYEFSALAFIYTTFSSFCTNILVYILSYVDEMLARGLNI